MRRSEGRGPQGRGGPLGRGGLLGAADEGFVTAETAVVVPSLVLLVATLMWGVTAAAGMVQCVDGARAGARAAARGEQERGVREVVRAVAPPGAQVRLRREGSLVRVTVEARAAGPGALALPLEAEAVAFSEEARPRSVLPKPHAGSSPESN